MRRRGEHVGIPLVARFTGTAQLPKKLLLIQMQKENILAETWSLHQILWDTIPMMLAEVLPAAPQSSEFPFCLEIYLHFLPYKYEFLEVSSNISNISHPSSQPEIVLSDKHVNLSPQNCLAVDSSTRVWIMSQMPHPVLPPTVSDHRSVLFNLLKTYKYCKATDANPEKRVEICSVLGTTISARSIQYNCFSICKIFMQF